MKNRLSTVTGALIALVTTLAPVGFAPAMAAPARIVSSPFLYDFRVNGTLEEASTMDASSSPYFWLNSGGLMYLLNGVGMTVQGNLPLWQRWNKMYAAANPLDTDGGAHPQNLFRLVTRSKWQNFSQEAYFNITKYNVSASPNRDGHNGILFFNHYALNGQTLYYAGIRVDGSAIIKKKLNGRYTTLASNKVLPGTYNRSTNPNLIPTNTWIGMRSVIRDNSNGSVTVDLYTDIGRTGVWKKVLSTTDNGINGPAITGSGYAGIRTDFMDAKFDDYRNANVQ